MVQMKFNRNHLFILLTSVALVTVLVIQVRWVLQTARMKEELFNERANLVLTRTAEALSLDTATCKNLVIRAGENEVKVVDSLFAHYMQQYNIRMDYHFEVNEVMQPVYNPMQGIGTGLEPSGDDRQGCYTACLSGDSGDHVLELKLVIPGKSQFIQAEMGLPFIGSVLLILIVILLSWRTVLSLMKEKEIARHTTEFLNNMTHEFKTPITNIALAGSRMVKQDNIRQEDKVQYYAGIIRHENEKLLQQVEQALSIQALERGELPLQLAEVDVHALLQKVVSGFTLQAEERQVQLNMKLAAGKQVVKADAAYLAYAISNLVDNAIKYSGPGATVTIATANENHHLVMTITDTGPGIDRKYRHKIFEPYFRVPTGNVHDVKGTGLGLAYARKIILLHKGTLLLKSEKDKGAVFELTLDHV